MSGIRVIVLGLGVQGYKRRNQAGPECVATIDPINPQADCRDVRDFPLRDYDAAMVCVPDGPKVELLDYLLGNGKHVLVEKPLWAKRDEDIGALEALARANDAVCYVAYNHRFEPHFVRMRELLESGALGKIYSCRMFYGNGTARLVRDSVWRDQGAGVLPDLGSHLLDTCAFWFGAAPPNFRVAAAHRFENRAPDHVVLSCEGHQPRFEFEMTLCMWRNHFTCDILAERGSAHIELLCKWGPSTFTHRTRVLPSGRPGENRVRLVQDDPTWALEYEHFKNLIGNRQKTDLAPDLVLQKTLRHLCDEALRT